MWIYSKKSNAAYNINHVARLFVEVTGSGAALKAEIAGKPQMLAYFDDKEMAMAALLDILAKREMGIPLMRM
jgi:hypothetical protein